MNTDIVTVNMIVMSRAKSNALVVYQIITIKSFITISHTPGYSMPGLPLSTVGVLVAMLERVRLTL